MNKTAIRNFAVTARQKLTAASDEKTAYLLFFYLTALRFIEVNSAGKKRIFTDENGMFQPIHQEQLTAHCQDLHQLFPEIFKKLESFPNILFDGNGVIADMISMIPEQDWKEQVQIMGWLYQYYHSVQKNKTFANLRKNIKIPAEEIPAVTQLFTPEWIVRYMIENSLGRLWLKGHPDSELKNNLSYYMEEAPQKEAVHRQLAQLRKEYQKITPEQIKIIDPCMGAGNILVYAFDVLIQIYLSCGYTPPEAVRKILTHNLYGLDIDRKAYELTYFALMMKAEQYDSDFLKYPDISLNIACFADIETADNTAFAEQFSHADSCGSLIQVTVLRQEAPPNMLKIYDILNQQYDIVCTNPPYMGNSGMNAELSSFVKEHFPDSKSDLFACFMERCGQLTKENGFYAMLTMQSWMFLFRFQKLRRRLMQHDVINLLHLGMNAFEYGEVGTIVQAAAFVMRRTDYNGYQGSYLNLCSMPSSEEKRTAYLNRTQIYTIDKKAFEQIAGCPYAYWASEQVFQLFANETLGSVAEPRQGMTTSDNNRFVRKWFEVRIDHICFDAQNSELAQKSHKKWFPYHKGGGYRKWYGNHEYLVNYEDDGRELKAFHEKLNKVSTGGRIKNKEYYFRKSIAWNFIAAVPGFRYCPEGFIFDVAGSSLFTEEAQTEYILGFLCSCVARYLLNILNPTMNIQANDIKSLPYLYRPEDRIQELVSENITLCREDWDSFETSWDFEQHPLL